MTAAFVASHITVRFGGLTAVDDLSFSADVGRITGLIGPNGAGKSTAFNACFGMVPNAGTVQLHGLDVSRATPDARARLGMGRTFQRVQLYDELTVDENVQLGFEAARAGRNPLHHVWAPRSEREAMTAVSDAAMQRCGIGGLRETVAGALPLGQRRLVELARALAGDPNMLFLDEPASGLDHDETVELGAILTDLVSDGRRGVVIVEHDMDLVMSVCAQLFVLDFGQLVFAGTPAEVRASNAVRAAYLGSTAPDDSEVSSARR